MDERRLSHFRILARIGQGGMGIVYKAEDERLGRLVALKVLPPGSVGDPARRARFLREARAAAAVTHPAIAAVYEVGEEGEDVFIAMEYAEGQTLRTLLESGPRPMAEAVRMAAEIAHGLERAHAAGVVHRDLKPENVIVTAEGHPKILDFGLAKLRAGPALAPVSQAETLAAGEDLVTREGMVVGTAAYMSPEQARGLAVDARSDLFSLGVVLYEVLTGRNPFRGPTPVDTLSAVLKDRPRPAGDLNAQVPLALERLLDRLLAKDPAQRPASAAELARDLEALAQAPPAPGATRAAGQSSIAVLPFADMSPQKDQDYFCEGIAEELINVLAHVEGLKVAARTSAFQFKGRADDVRRIGHQLGVETVLEGSVRKAGQKLRVTAQLVNTADGYHLWSERYDREMEDVFAIQDEIAATIVETLKIRMAERETPRVHRAENLEAYHLYLQGRYWWNKRHQAGLRKAREFFEQAVLREPSYVLAHAGLADGWSVAGFYGFEVPTAAAARAREAAERALALDEELADAHVSMALVLFWFDWRWAEAEREFRRALALDRQHVAAHMFLGQLLAAWGRASEAEAEWQAALERDPLSPLTNGIVASGLYFARRYEAARARCAQALALEPDHVQSLFAAALIDGQLGRHAESMEEARRAASLAGRSPFFLGIQGLVCGAQQPEEARALLEELRERSSREYVMPLALAWVHVGLGEAEAALDYLERAYEEHNSLFLFAVIAQREFDFLRDRPRFKALAARLNLGTP